jgi:dsRNA-specific ribonuclease
LTASARDTRSLTASTRDTRALNAALSVNKALSTKDYESAISAFMNRTGLNLDMELIKQSLIHPSYKDNELPSEKLHILGNVILKMYSVEYVLSKYPNLPVDLVNMAVTSYTSNVSLSRIGETWGLQYIVKAKVFDLIKSDAPIVKSWAVAAILGALYQSQGPAQTRQFVMKHVLSRAVDLEELNSVYLKMRQPRKLLAHIADKLKQPRPVARLLKETGRQSSAPIFIVGMYCGEHKIGEGHGSSMKMAEYRVILANIGG